MQDQMGKKAVTVTNNHSCPSCKARMRVFYGFRDVPTNSCILMATIEEARAYPRGDVLLGFCDACGFICNTAFDTRLAEYTGRYEETQGFSPTFRLFHRALAEDLVERYGLQGKSVLEIGCGKGEFLALLSERGLERGVGFDPGYDPQRGVLNRLPDVRVIKDFYSEKFADHRADLVCCKMTLEHIPRTADFIRLSRQALHPEGSSVMYLQVPEALRIFRDCAFEDIYYEHCSYFTAGSLARLFRAQGLELIHLYTAYADQYLAIEASLAVAGRSQKMLPQEDDLHDLRRFVQSFPERCDTKIEQWRTKLSEAALSGSVVLWGSGSKAVSFLNLVDHQGVVDRVVDINPYRQKHFMPGTAQPIIAPEALPEYPPTAVVIMNPIYRKEIVAYLDKLDIRAQVLAL